MHRNTLSRTITELKLDVRALRNEARRPPGSARPGLAMEKKDSPVKLQITRSGNS